MANKIDKAEPPQTWRRVAPGVMMSHAPAHADRKKHLVQLHAESLADLIAHASTTGALGRFENQNAARGNRAKMEWDLNAGWNGALEIARTGWRQGARKIAEAMATLPGDMRITPPQVSDIAGGVLDCAAHVAGAPDCFDVDDDDAPGRARVVRLLIPLSANCGVDAKQLVNRGAAIASVIDALEAGGISCEVEASSVHSEEYGQAVVRHIVKRAGDPLNIDALASSVAHPATFRRIHFAGLESLGDQSITAPITGDEGRKIERTFKVDSLSSGYGSPQEYEGKDLEPTATFELKNFSHGNHETPEDSRRSIAEQMRELGFNVSFESDKPEPTPAQ